MNAGATASHAATMRTLFPRGLIVVAAAAVALAGCSSPGAGPTTPAPATPDSHTNEPAVSADLGQKLSAAHAATARYATDLAAAEKDGYMIITGMMPGMGFHYLNPKIEGFDASKPAILVYLKNQTSAQLVALEWVFPQKPATPPLEGATYGSFAAACHYKDGTFKPTPAEKDCAATSPDSGSPFNFWHPDLVTMHVWLWYHNPAGLYHGTNPLVDPYTA